MRKVPNYSSAIYKAAMYIVDHGPQTVDALFVAVDFGTKTSRNTKLNHAFEVDWLRRTGEGLIEMTDNSKQHFADKRPKEQAGGQVAPPAYRGDVFATQGLSKRFIPDSRGPRAEETAWSRRADRSILRG